MAGRHRGSSAAELVLLKQLLQQGQAIKEFAFVIQQKRPMQSILQHYYFIFH
jgi:hypothetical protein